jgi:hypothetical protein
MRGFMSEELGANLDKEPCWLPNDSFTHLQAETSNRQPDASTAEMRVPAPPALRDAQARRQARRSQTRNRNAPAGNLSGSRY